MLKPITQRPISILICSLVGIVFGLATIKSGGSVIFIDGSFRKSVGNYISFIVWFNFLFGFVYLAASAGLWYQKRWAVWVSLLIASATLIAFGVLIIYIVSGGLYELRTIYAMIFRFTVWLLISIVAYTKISRIRSNTT